MGAGSNVTYAIIVKNRGPADASAAEIKVTFAGGLIVHHTRQHHPAGMDLHDIGHLQHHDPGLHEGNPLRGRYFVHIHPCGEG